MPHYSLNNESETITYTNTYIYIYIYFIRITLVTNGIIIIIHAEQYILYKDIEDRMLKAKGQ